MPLAAWRAAQHERQRRIRIDVERRGDAGAEFPQPGGGNHRGVVGRQLQARHERRHLARVAVRLDVGAQAAVRRHAAGDADAPRAVAACGGERALDQRRDDHALEAGADVGDLAVRERRALFAPGVTWRSTAVFRPLKLKSRSPFSCGRIAIGMRQARGRQRNRAVVALPARADR